MQHLSVLRPGDPRPRVRRDARGARSAAGRRDRGAARLLPQPDRRRPDAGAVARGPRRSCARAGSCRSSTSPTRASPTASTRTPTPCASSRGAMSPVFLSSSFSKSFSLYGERVGALQRRHRRAPRKRRACCRSSSASCAPITPIRRRTAASSSPPCSTTPELRALWEQELGAMRERIKAHAPGRWSRRSGERAPESDFSFVAARSAACSPTRA